MEDSPRQSTPNQQALDARSWLSQAAATTPSYEQLLRATAKELNEAEIGWIPVRGIQASDHASAKRPTINTWSPGRASLQLQQSWFDSGKVGGIAIFTGGDSRLFLLDLDPDADPTAYAQFVAELPDVAAALTYTEQTPASGIHEVLRMPPNVSHLDTIKSSVGELRGDRVYTVIAPTQTPLGTYVVTQGNFSTIYTVTEEQLERIIAFYRSRPKAVQEQSRPTLKPDSIKVDLQYHELDAEITARLGVTEYGSDGFSNAISCPFHDDRDPSAYWHRKGFLYCHVGCTSPNCKKAGCNLRIDVARALGIMLKPQTAPPIHATSIQALLQRFPGKAGGEGIATVLYCVLHSLPASRQITRAMVTNACVGIVGRRVQERAFDELTDLKIFNVHIEQVSNDEAHDLEGGTHTLLRDTCSIRTQNPIKRAKGKPAQFYSVATADEIAGLLNVEPRGALNIKPAELKTRKLTDLLVERHVEGREAEYSYRQLGKDYGKSRSTIRRHVVANARIERTPTYRLQVPITSPSMLETLMADLVKPVEGVPESEVAAVTAANSRRVRHCGRYLESSKSGRRYPPTPSAAQYLLERGETPILFERGLNRLSINAHVSAEAAAAERYIHELKARAYRVVRRVFSDNDEYLQAQRYIIQAAFKHRNRMQLEQVISDAKKASTYGFRIIRPSRGKCRSCGHYTADGAVLCPECAVALPVAAGAENSPIIRAALEFFERYTPADDDANVSRYNPFSKGKTS